MKSLFGLAAIVATVFAMIPANAFATTQDFWGDTKLFGSYVAGVTVQMQQSTSSSGPWTTVQTCTSYWASGIALYDCGYHADNYWYRAYATYVPNCFRYWGYSQVKYQTAQTTAYYPVDMTNSVRWCAPPAQPAAQVR
jgi:hypothetical protein